MILLNYFIKIFVNKILYIYMNIVLLWTSSAEKTSILKEIPEKYNTISNDDLFKKYDFRICKNN